MVEGKGKTYRSTSSPLSFSILSEVGRGGWWGVWLCFAAMLWTFGGGEIWCVVSLSGLAFSALREMNFQCAALTRAPDRRHSRSQTFSRCESD